MINIFNKPVVNKSSTEYKKILQLIEVNEEEDAFEGGSRSQGREKAKASRKMTWRRKEGLA